MYGGFRLSFVSRYPFLDRDLESSFRQTSHSSGKFLNMKNEKIKTVQNNFY